MDKFHSWMHSASKVVRHPLRSLGEPSDIVRANTGERFLRVLELAFPPIARIHSADPRDIGVEGDPPVCRACSRIFSKAGKSPGLETILSMNLDRLKKSIELGCYICTLYFNAVWSPFSSKRTEPLAAQRLKDIIPIPNLVIGYIEKSFQSLQPGCLDLCLVAVDQANKSDVWFLRLVLFPEKGIGDQRCANLRLSLTFR
jgi:hypothetical protein